jgi:hypothetical protein
MTNLVINCNPASQELVKHRDAERLVEYWVICRSEVCCRILHVLCPIFKTVFDDLSNPLMRVGLCKVFALKFCLQIVVRPCFIFSCSITNRRFKYRTQKHLKIRHSLAQTTGNKWCFFLSVAGFPTRNIRWLLARPKQTRCRNEKIVNISCAAQVYCVSASKNRFEAQVG